MITKINSIFSSKEFDELSINSIQNNEWLTRDFINYAREAIKEQFLAPQIVKQFCLKQRIDQQPKGKTVGILCAGNLPLVGFGDMFYSLLGGYEVVLKTSSKDPLMSLFASLDDVTLANSIDELHGVDAILAMGSDATCKIVEAKFPTTPLLLRGSMHSIAILTGEESPEQLTALTDDMFLYCSRGCRSVTHLYIPTGYDFELLKSTIAKSKFSTHNYLPRSWYECYISHRALLTLTNKPFIDGLFYTLTPKRADIAATFGYSFYNNLDEIPTSKVQHIAQGDNFGTAQRPTIEDFANNINIIEWLATNIK